MNDEKHEVRTTNHEKDPLRTPAGHSSFDLRHFTEVFVVRAEDRDRLRQRLRALADYLERQPDVEPIDLAYTLSAEPESGAARLAIVAGSVAELRGRLERAAGRLADPKCRRINETQGIYYFQEPLHGQGRLALLFPGEGAQYPNMLADLLPHFPEVRAHFQNCDRISLFAGKRSRPISRSIFLGADATVAEQEAAERDLARLDNAVASVLVANWALYQVLWRLGLRGDAVAGHSSGEISALAAAGCIVPDDQLFAELFALGRVLQEDEDQGRMADAALLAVGAGRRQVAEVIERVQSSEFGVRSSGFRGQGVGDHAQRLGNELLNPEPRSLNPAIAMDNCPHQTVVGGTLLAVEAVERRLRAAGVVCERLPFHRAYHTSLFQPHLEPIARMYEAIAIRPPRLPVYSCLTGEPFPDDPAEIRRQAVSHWASRVEFTRLIEAMHDDGVRLFVEVGPRGNLTSFAQDILRGRKFEALASNLHRRSGISQINHLVGQLMAHHVPLELDYLYCRRHPRAVAWESLPVHSVLAGGVEGRGPGQESPQDAGPRRSTSSPAAAAVLTRYLETMEDFLRLQREVHQRFLATLTGRVKQRDSTRIMIGEVIHHEPGRRLVMRRRMDLDEDRYARDHTLGGRNASATDADHHGLAVMPMALNLEMMAEVASLLLPGKLVVGLKRVRLRRWIPLYEEPITLEVAAEVCGRTGCEVSLVIRDLGNASQPGEAESPAVEGVVLLGQRYPDPPEVEPFPLSEEGPCRLGPDELYRTECRLFHGPAFQAVVSTDRMGKEGIEGCLRTLSHAGLFASTDEPNLLLDPLLIDASTHILGCWHLTQPEQTGRVVFPFELGSVQLFGPRPAEGTQVKCRVRIEKSSARQVSHRIELLTPDGRLWCRLHPAEYWRFYWPPEYVAFFRHHEQFLIAKDWPAALPSSRKRRVQSPELSTPDSRLSTLDSPLSTLDSRPGSSPSSSSSAARCLRVEPTGDIVQPVIRAALARVALSREEWQRFYQMDGPDRRRTEWLFGRIAAKDCVRALWQERHGEQLFPADLEIQTDPHGRPVARHRTIATEDLPRISIAHSGGVIAALAAWQPHVGIDVEHVKSRSPPFERIALDPRERELLDRFQQNRDEAITRFWSAKEAVAKALGHGLIEGPRTLAVREVDLETGTVYLELGPRLGSSFPEFQSSLLPAWTYRQQDLVVATTFAEESILEWAN